MKKSRSIILWTTVHVHVLTDSFDSIDSTPHSTRLDSIDSEAQMQKRRRRRAKRAPATSSHRLHAAVTAAGCSTGVRRCAQIRFHSIWLHFSIISLFQDSLSSKGWAASKIRCELYRLPWKNKLENMSWHEHPIGGVRMAASTQGLWLMSLYVLPIAPLSIPLSIMYVNDLNNQLLLWEWIIEWYHNTNQQRMRQSNHIVLSQFSLITPMTFIRCSGTTPQFHAKRQ